MFRHISRRFVSGLLSLLLIGSGAVSVGQAVSSAPADLVLLNGKILTVDQKFTVAEAVAIKDGRFVAVGRNAQVRPLIGRQTQVIDCRGRTVVPGLIDSHVHASSVAENEASEQPYEELTSIAEIQAWVRRVAGRIPAGEWILIPRSYPPRLKELRFPTRAELDAATDRHPVLFDAAYGQVLNTMGLQRAKLDRNSPPLAVGEIVRDAAGEPTGLLRNARGYLNKFINVPEATQAARLASLEKVHERYLSVGLTSVIERGASLRDYELYRALYDAGKLRVRSRITIRLPGTTAAEAEQFIKSLPIRYGQGDEWLKVGPLKIVVDGGILIGNAYLREPYGEQAQSLYNLSDPHYRGSLSLTPQSITELFRTGHKLGWQMSAHVTGDAGVDEVLQALAKVNQEIPLVNKRFNLIHAYFPNQAAVEQAKKLGVVVDTQPAWYFKDADVLRAALGQKRLEPFIGVADWQRAGLVVAANTDHMLGLDPNRALNPFNPFLTMYVLVTRRTQQGTVIGPAQQVSRADALRMMTINAAYLSFDEKQKGSIEVGKLADLAILSEDFLTCPAERIKDINVLTTVVNGKVVFERKK